MTVTENHLSILIFKTNVSTKGDLEVLKPILGSYPAITDWSVDLEDCDRVLRVVGNDIKPERITRLLKESGYECETLL